MNAVVKALKVKQENMVQLCYDMDIKRPIKLRQNINNN